MWFQNVASQKPTPFRHPASLVALLVSLLVLSACAVATGSETNLADDNESSAPDLTANDEGAGGADNADDGADNNESDTSSDDEMPAGDEDSGTETGGATAPVAVDGEPLAPSQEPITNEATEPSLGKVAPTITGTTFDGEEVTVGPDGRAKVIYFLAHWCPHCQAEVPVIQAMIDDGRLPEGVDVYAVSTAVDLSRGNPPQAWLEGEGFQPIVIRDDDASTALSAFSAGGFPYAVYLDANHQVVARSNGSIDSGVMGLLWEAAATGTPPPADAGSAEEGGSA